MDQSVSIIRSDRQQHNRNKNEKKKRFIFSHRFVEDETHHSSSH